MAIPPDLIVGIVLGAGFLAGRLATRVGLPTVTGYILAGILINPAVLPVIPPSFPEHTNLVTHIALAFITFEVGSSITRTNLRRLGSSILSIVFFEAELATIATVAGLLISASLLGLGSFQPWSVPLLAFCLVVGSLASPTDPSATLAVVHEYRAEGDVTSTVLGVAAFDDVMGLMNYSLCVAAAVGLLAGGPWLEQSVLSAGVQVFGGVSVGLAIGFSLSFASCSLTEEGEGSLIVLVFAALAVCFGLASAIGVDELLATMTMGTVVVNRSPCQTKIFSILRRYTEELVFVLFFTISSMHLAFNNLSDSLVLTVVYVLSRASGKLFGSYIGARLSNTPSDVRRYVGFALIPQGGIVVGLALFLRTNPAFGEFSDLLVSLVIGATVLHELVGPVLTRSVLRRTGEIRGPLQGAGPGVRNGGAES